MIQNKRTLMTKSKRRGMTDLTELTTELIERLEDILIELGVTNYETYGDRIAFPCPIHGGDNEEGACIYTQGNGDYIGNWKCWTRSCEEELVIDHKDGEEIERERGYSIYGFIRGVLANQYGRHVEYGEAINWAKEFLKFEGTSEAKRENIVLSATEIFNRERKVVVTNISREQVRSKLNIPSSYFEGRGFLTETLERYDVGLCTEKGREMFHRVVAPFYDDDYKCMVGCMGRTIQPKCNKCGLYHYENRPCPRNKIEKKWAQKWINNKGFSAENYLYNYWFAKDIILETGLAILVEGQPDIWRLEEAGFHMGLGLSRVNLTDNQKMILDASGATDLIILSDNDKAGQEGREKIYRKCQRYFNCHFIDLEEKDIGDTSVEEVRALLGPIVEKFL